MGERSLCCGNILTLWKIDNVVNLAEVRIHHSVFGINSLTFSHEMRVCKYFRRMHHMLFSFFWTTNLYTPFLPPAWFNIFLLLFVIVSLLKYQNKEWNFAEGMTHRKCEEDMKIEQNYRDREVAPEKNILFPYFDPIKPFDCVVSNTIP